MTVLDNKAKASAQAAPGSLRGTVAFWCRAMVCCLAVIAGLTVAGCSGGTSAMTQPIMNPPAFDLDTAKPPPQTVTSAPLLPPVPDQPAPTETGLAAIAPPMQYEHLYSEDEQAKIAAELAIAGAKAQRN